MFRRLISTFVPIVCAGTVILGTVYVVAQQMIRQSADDPQIERARDAARALGAGDEYVAGPGQSHIDIDQSLAPFDIVFDDRGTIIASTGYINGRTPIPPTGVFDQVRTDGEYRLTWQPLEGVRIAAVVVRYQGSTSGFVLSGRSLNEAESRISHLGSIIFMGWGFMILATLIFVLITPGSQILPAPARQQPVPPQPPVPQKPRP